MRLCEIQNTLTSDELNKVLNESISDELKDMVKSNVTAPFLEFRKRVIDNFAKKLKAWAIVMLHDLQKGADFDDSKHYVKTLDKIINNPTGIASQLLANVMSNYSAKPDVKTVEKPEMMKLDSVLDGVKF